MAQYRNRFASATALVAALSMAAIPAAAAELPRGASITPGMVYDGDAENASRHRWRGNRGHRGPRTGDVIAGILVLGTIAAIAGSASKKNERERVERYPSRTPYPEDRRYREPQRGRADSSGLGRAVDMCVGEVERMRESVGSVDSASRRGDGWHVGGELRTGNAFTCRIDNDGRVSDIQFGGQADFSASVPTGSQAQVAGAQDSAQAGSQGEQWNDADYARARTDTAVTTSSLQPAYPGGPFEGEAVNESDGRYSLEGAPDFKQG